MIRSDSNDNEGSEEDSVDTSAFTASVMNNLIYLNNNSILFFSVIATQCTIGSVQIRKSELLYVYSSYQSCTLSFCKCNTFVYIHCI